MRLIRSRIRPRSSGQKTLIYYFRSRRSARPLASPRPVCRRRRRSPSLAGRLLQVARLRAPALPAPDPRVARPAVPLPPVATPAEHQHPLAARSGAPDRQQRLHTSPPGSRCWTSAGTLCNERLSLPTASPRLGLRVRSSNSGPSLSAALGADDLHQVAASLDRFRGVLTAWVVHFWRADLGHFSKAPKTAPICGWSAAAWLW